MIWNEWCLDRVVEMAELEDAARRLAERSEGIEGVSVGASAIEFDLDEEALERVVADLALDLLGAEWKEDIDPPAHEGRYAVSILFASNEDETHFRWEPRQGDNKACWPVAWLLCVELMESLSAERVTLSAASLLEEWPSVIEEGAAITLPLVPFRGPSFVPAPSPTLVPVGRAASIDAVERAVAEHEGLCFVGLQRDPATEEPALDDLYGIGCVARIEGVDAPTGEVVRVLFRGLERAELVHRTGALVTVRALASERESFDEDERAPIVALAERVIPASPDMLENLPDDGVDVLREIDGTHLADAAAQIFWPLLDDDSRRRVFRSPGRRERLAIVVAALAVVAPPE